MMKTFLRNLKESDIDILYKVENDKTLWKYSNQKEGFTKKILKKYIKIASVENLFSANQKRFVIQGFDSTVKGFIDLYDYNAEKRNAFVGIVILKKFRNKGIGTRSLKLLEKVSESHGIKELNVKVNPVNIFSIKLFKRCGFREIKVDLLQKTINYD